MENQVNLFLISTALQLINANEAKAKFVISDQSSILIISAYSHNLIAIKKVVDSSKWKEVHYVNDNLDFIKIHEENIKNKKYINALKVVISNYNKSLKIISNYDIVNNLFVGNYSNIEMLNLTNRINYKSLVLIDDGIGTIEINERRKKNISYMKDFGGKLDIKVMVKRFLVGYKISHPKYACFFTAYNIKTREGDIKVANDFIETKKLIHKQIRSNDIYFIGGPYSELSPILLTERNYFRILTDIKEYFKDMNFIYVPHKAESPEKVSKIKEQLNISVQSFDLPIELSLINLKSFPSVMSGFISSALVNSKFIFGNNLSIISIKMNKDMLVNSDVWDDINNVYNYYASIADDNFKVVELYK